MRILAQCDEMKVVHRDNLQGDDVVQEAVRQRLRDCRLYVFDLDGTVYEETNHFHVYGEELANRLPGERQQRFRATAGAALRQEGELAFGGSFDAGNGRYFAQGMDLPEGVDAGRLIHVDDPWGVYAALALYHGITPEGLAEAFLTTREHMASDQFSMKPMKGLREALLRMKSLSVHLVLATNSPEPDSRALLRKLQLDDLFEDHSFLSQKPHRIRELFRGWSKSFDVPLNLMASVGDHYRNEMSPATELGIATIYIDRYIRKPHPELTLQLTHPGQLASTLLEVFG